LRGGHGAFELLGRLKDIEWDPYEKVIACSTLSISECATKLLFELERDIKMSDDDSWDMEKEDEETEVESSLCLLI
jgi:hypothetical protein